MSADMETPDGRVPPCKRSSSGGRAATAVRTEGTVSSAPSPPLRPRYSSATQRTRRGHASDSQRRHGRSSYRPRLLACSAQPCESASQEQLAGDTTASLLNPDEEGRFVVLPSTFYPCRPLWQQGAPAPRQVQVLSKELGLAHERMTSGRASDPVSAGWLLVRRPRGVRLEQVWWSPVPPIA